MPRDKNQNQDEHDLRPHSGNDHSDKKVASESFPKTSAKSNSDDSSAVAVSSTNPIQGHAAQPQNSPPPTSHVSSRTSSQPPASSASTRFKFHGLIGKGGNGSVFRAYDRVRHEMVAVKILKFADASARMRFKDEFRLVRNITHENLVKMHELTSEGGRLMLVMELVEGGVPFVDYVRGRRVTSNAPTLLASEIGASQEPPSSSGQPTVRINTQKDDPILDPERSDYLRRAVIGLVRGLMAIHAAGKIHRDIKPENVLIDAEGRVVILDFGLVAEPEEGNVRSSRFEITGTPEYMSVEQSRGQVGGPASDFYSVGVMIYETLVGRVPFTGRSPLQVISAKQFNEPPDIRDQVPEPLRATADLAMKLLDPDPSKRPGGAEILEHFGASPDLDFTVPAVPISTKEGGLVGRVHELAELELALQRVRTRGHSLTFLVRGPSAVGKTALVDTFLNQVQALDVAHVLRGRCFEAETVPFKALDSLVDSLTKYLDRLRANELAEFADLDMPPLIQVFPSLQKVWPQFDPRDAVGDLMDGEALSTEWTVRDRAFLVLAQLLERVANDKPLVAWVDDVQWGDVDSARFFRDLASETKGILLILSFREEAVEASAFLRTFFDQASGGSAGAKREMKLEPLNLDYSEDLALQCLPTDLPEKERQTLAAKIARDSGGSPFFVLEMCRGTSRQQWTELRDEDGQQSLLYESLKWRLERLSPSSRRLLEVASVAARATPVSVLAHAASIEEGLASCVDELLRAHMVQTQEVDGERQLEPYHDRIREWITEQLDEKQLRSIHASLAQALEQFGSYALDAIATHYRLGGEAQKAGQFALLAADKASDQLAFDHAAKMYRVALETHTGKRRREILRKLANALGNAGYGLQAAKILRQLIPEAESDDEAIALRATAANLLLRAGQVHEGLVLSRDLLEYAGWPLTDNRLLALMRLLVCRLRLRLRGTEFQPAKHIDSEGLRRLDIAWNVSMGISNIDVMRASELLCRIVRKTLDMGEPSRAVKVLCAEATFLSTRGPRVRERTEQLIHQAKQIFDSKPSPISQAYLEFAEGLSSWFFGEWDRGHGHLLRAIERAQQTAGARWEMTTARHYACWSLCQLGELSRMRRLVHIWLPEALDRDDRYSATSLRLFMTNMVWLMQDSPEQAREQARQAIQDWNENQREFQAQHYYAWFALTHADIYDGKNLAKALQETERTDRLLRSSLLSRIETVRLEFQRTKARLLLSAIDRDFGPPDVHRRGVLEAMKRMQKEQLRHMRPSITQLQATLAFQDGNLEQALRDLEQARRGYESLKMMAEVAAIDWQMGRLIGGDEGRELQDKARVWFTEQGVAAPERLAYIYCPGFERAKLLPSSTSSTEDKE